MPKYLYRVSLIHAEPTNAKTRTKNMGCIAQCETDSRPEARAEIERLREMTARSSWQIPTSLVVERSEITDFVAVDIDTLEPHIHNAADSEELPEAIVRQG